MTFGDICGCIPKLFPSQSNSLVSFSHRTCGMHTTVDVIIINSRFVTLELAPTVAGCSKDIIRAPGADSSPDSLHQLSNGLHSRALKKTPLPIKDDDSNEEILPTFFFPIFSNGLPNIMTVSKL